MSARNFSEPSNFFSEETENNYKVSFLLEKTNNGESSSLPCEIETGNVEYKLKICSKSKDRIEHLTSQLKWRLAEGHGECLYEVGVSDSGRLVGLTEEELSESLDVLRGMGKELLADVSIIRERIVNDNPPRKVAEVLIRKTLTDEQHFLEIRVAIVGSEDAGKSTLLGVVSTGELDNGRGKARLNLLRHRHEIESGRTSSISHALIGYTPKGELINYATPNVKSWEEVVELGSKVVTFLDLPGFPKYQHTTFAGLTGQAPHYSCLIVDSCRGTLSKTSHEHLNISMHLKLPIVVVMTKIDAVNSDNLTKTLSSLLSCLKSPSVRRQPAVIENEDDMIACMQSFISCHCVPIILTSAVSGENIPLLSKFFNLLPKPVGDNDDILEGESEFNISELYNTDTGLIVAGILRTGRINLNTYAGKNLSFYIGPHYGRFVEVQIVSIQRQRCACKYIVAGQAATLKVKVVETDSNGASIETSISSDCSNFSTSDFEFRRGQVLLSYPPSEAKDGPSDGTIEFKALLNNIHMNAVMANHGGLELLNKHGVVFSASVRQAAKITNVVEEADGKLVTLRFVNQSEWLAVGATIIFRSEGDSEIKLVGKIVQI